MLLKAFAAFLRSFYRILQHCGLAQQDAANCRSALLAL